MRFTFEGTYHEIREAIGGMGKTLHEADRPSLAYSLPPPGMPNPALEALKKVEAADARVHRRKPVARKRKR